MTEQHITVTKIEPHPDGSPYWRIHLEGNTYIVRSTADVRAMGLTPPAPDLTITIGEHTTTINRDDAAAFELLWRESKEDSRYGRTARALADLLRAAREDTP